MKAGWQYRHRYCNNNQAYLLTDIHEVVSNAHVMRGVLVCSVATCRLTAD